MGQRCVVGSKWMPLGKDHSEWKNMHEKCSLQAETDQVIMVATAASSFPRKRKWSTGGRDREIGRQRGIKGDREKRWQLPIIRLSLGKSNIYIATMLLSSAQSMDFKRRVHPLTKNLKRCYFTYPQNGMYDFLQWYPHLMVILKKVSLGQYG